MEHYYTEKPTSKIVENTFSQTLKATPLTFTTASGLFSQKEVDFGSALLIEEGLIKPNWRVLDLGCGYGAIGIAFKKSEPTINITFTDINIRAIEYTKKNLAQNNIEIDNTIEIVSGDGFNSISGQYDAIYLNPPHSAGKELCFSLIEKSKKYLKPEGSLQIVARKNKGGQTLANHMQEVFGNVKDNARASGYWIYASFNK